MLITSTDIKKIIALSMPKGRWIHINDIQDIVERNYPLTSQDWNPYTNTRKTNYPIWKHRIQGVLSTMKSEGKIIHDETNNCYMF